MKKFAVILSVFALAGLTGCGSQGQNSFVVEPGRTVKTDSSISSAALFGKGWSTQESSHRWSNAKSAELKIALRRKPEKSVVFNMLGAAFLGKKSLENQKVTVKVNGKRVTVWQVDKLKWYSTTVPAGLFSNTDMNVEFIISNPLSPKELKMSDDSRKLGLQLRGITVKY